MIPASALIEARILVGPDAWLTVVDALLDRPTTFECSKTTSHTLYVFTGVDGRVLYIGLTSNMAQRFYSHIAVQPWRHQAVACYWRTDICCRRHAQHAERLAIQALTPVHNKAVQ